MLAEGLISWAVPDLVIEPDSTHNQNTQEEPLPQIITHEYISNHISPGRDKLLLWLNSQLKLVVLKTPDVVTSEMFDTFPMYTIHYNKIYVCVKIYEHL